ncbi:hypothetical protein C8F04DRAFT_1262409 [Mycena alexandri]|uniref:Uncharacterized protein n=1 Tax=Mycena alexandri TaxID=1745969 RepID=A0AAD6X0G4_9AGAR|nr:hypothetical protein C8F04DRAFT_1262409 [Mycena alexandri]
MQASGLWPPRFAAAADYPCTGPKCINFSDMEEGSKWHTILTAASGPTCDKDGDGDGDGEDPTDGGSEPTGDDDPLSGNEEENTDADGDDDGEDSIGGGVNGEETTITGTTTFRPKPTQSHVPLPPMDPGPAEPPVTRRSRLSRRVEFTLE